MKTGCGGGGHLCILALPGRRAEASGCVAPFDPDHSPSMGVCCRLAPGEGAEAAGGQRVRSPPSGVGWTERKPGLRIVGLIP